MVNEGKYLWSRDSYLSTADCRAWLARIADYRSRNELPEIHRPMRGRSLRYSVIDGEAIAAAFPGLETFYREILELARQKSGLRLEPMRLRRVAININITRPGGEYRWHYDRNALTAILYLNASQGGVTEMYPGFRWALQGKTHSAWQERLDRLWMSGLFRRCFGRKIEVRPEPGRLLLMRGDRCLHSVTGVSGGEDRVNVIFSFDEVGAAHPQEAGLNDYLYTPATLGDSDPNYSKR